MARYVSTKWRTFVIVGRGVRDKSGTVVDLEKTLGRSWRSGWRTTQIQLSGDQRPRIDCMAFHFATPSFRVQLLLSISSHTAPDATCLGYASGPFDIRLIQVLPSWTYAVLPAVCPAAATAYHGWHGSRRDWHHEAG